jgi:hypothetical protein
MWAVPTVVVLLLLGPMVLLGFVVAVVVPTLYIAMHSKIREPEGMPSSQSAENGSA